MTERVIGRLVGVGRITVDYGNAGGIDEEVYTIDGGVIEGGAKIPGFETFMVVTDEIVLADNSLVYELYDTTGIYINKVVRLEISY